MKPRTAVLRSDGVLSMLHLITFVVSVSQWCSCLTNGQQATPRNLREIFIGNCWEYQQVVHPGWVSPPKNCTDLWVKFHSAFAYKGPCDVRLDDYDQFLQAANHTVETNNRVLYWEGDVIPLVYDYTIDGRRWMTIRDFLPGYIMKNLDVWCGKNDSTSEGMDFDYCPPWGSSCPGGSYPAFEAFWRACSASFAHMVQGEVHVILNGSSGMAFVNDTIFAMSELENLNAVRNPVLHLWLIHDIVPRSEQSVSENCHNGSLVHMKSIVEMKQIKFNCIDDPPEMLYFQCTDFVGAEKCKNIAGLPVSGANRKQRSPLLIPLLQNSVSLGLIIFLSHLLSDQLCSFTG